MKVSPQKQDLKIGVKDMIDVKGSRIVFDGKPVLVAAGAPIFAKCKGDVTGMRGC